MRTALASLREMIHALHEETAHAIADPNAAPDDRFEGYARLIEEHRMGFLTEYQLWNDSFANYRRQIEANSPRINSA